MTDERRRILLIGREGQVSRAAHICLDAAGHDVVQLARPDIDLANIAGLTDAVLAARPDIVVNPAAYTAVDKAEDEAALAEAINAGAAGTIAAAAARAGAPIIHFSTDYVFDGAKAEPYVETDMTGPLGVYGRTKLAGETLVAAANPRHVILRTAWVCSAFGNNFVKTILRLAGDRTELKVVDDQHGSPTFAGDLASLVATLVPRLTTPDAAPEAFGIFHATNSGQTTWCRFASAIIAGSSARGGRDIPVHAIATSDYPTKARRPAYSLLATGKLKTVHGITMRPWQEALSDCLDDLIGQPLNYASSQQKVGTGDKV